MAILTPSCLKNQIVNIYDSILTSIKAFNIVTELDLQFFVTMKSQEIINHAINRKSWGIHQGITIFLDKRSSIRPDLVFLYNNDPTIFVEFKFSIIDFNWNEIEIDLTKLDNIIAGIDSKDRNRKCLGILFICDCFQDRSNFEHLVNLTSTLTFPERITLKYINVFNCIDIGDFKDHKKRIKESIFPSDHSDQGNYQ